jgi:hypothetical protein
MRHILLQSICRLSFNRTIFVLIRFKEIQRLFKAIRLLTPPVLQAIMFLLRCQILGGAIHGDDLVVRAFARCAQQNGVREA